MNIFRFTETLYDYFYLSSEAAGMKISHEEGRKETAFLALICLNNIKA